MEEEEGGEALLIRDLELDLLLLVESVDMTAGVPWMRGQRRSS